MTTSSAAAPAGPAPAAPAKPRKPRYPATVKRIEQLTPRMVRVTFTSTELADFGWSGPAAHLKLIFSSAEPTLPTAASSSGAAASAASAGASSEPPRPTMRTYTPRRFDRDSRELDVDFVLHGEGPASTWASQAAVGQTLTVAGPGRNYVVDPGADWFVLAGDDSAIPAIATILEQLPPTAQVTVFIEVVDAKDEHRISAASNATVTWLHRGEDNKIAGTLLEARLRDLQLPPGSGRIYVACESGAMRRIRRHLLTERSLSRDHVVTRGYWKLGATDHPDGDYGQDV
ncbi:MAG: siderophore-interacting protein [Gammaproteobacteria bacterium]